MGLPGDNLPPGQPGSVRRLKVLLLAPHPFYQERGTPIAVHLLLRVLCARGCEVDLLTYHEGADVACPGLILHRIRPFPRVRGIAPGLSGKKLLCDLFLLARLPALLRRTRYDVVHAVEESVFLAMLVRWCTGLPYVFDMDSSMPLQIVEKRPGLRRLLPVLQWWERRAIRGALAVVAVCDALAEIARAAGARQVFLLRDASLLQPLAGRAGPGLRESLGIADPCFLYVGNLEPYQGVDLLLDSFARAVAGGMKAHLVIAGGAPADVARGRARAQERGIGPAVHFLGPQPVERMAWLFDGADVLVSPRIRGNNTPMKIYSYLHAGKAILATDLPTHRQVLTPEVACLAPADVESFAAAMTGLAGDAARRHALGERARALAEERHSLAAYQRQAGAIYDWIEDRLADRETGDRSQNPEE